MPAYNKRFCEMAVEVLAQIVVHGKTDGRNPNCSSVEPPLRKAAGRCMQTSESVVDNDRDQLIVKYILTT